MPRNKEYIVEEGAVPIDVVRAVREQYVRAGAPPVEEDRLFFQLGRVVGAFENIISSLLGSFFVFPNEREVVVISRRNWREGGWSDFRLAEMGRRRTEDQVTEEEPLRPGTFAIKMPWEKAVKFDVVTRHTEIQGTSDFRPDLPGLIDAELRFEATGVIKKPITACREYRNQAGALNVIGERLFDAAVADSVRDPRFLQHIRDILAEGKQIGRYPFGELSRGISNKVGGVLEAKALHEAGVELEQLSLEVDYPPQLQVIAQAEAEASRIIKEGAARAEVDVLRTQGIVQAIMNPIGQAIVDSLPDEMKFEIISRIMDAQTRRGAADERQETGPENNS